MTGDTWSSLAGSGRGECNPPLKSELFSDRPLDSVSRLKGLRGHYQRSETLDGRDKMKFEAFIVQVSRYIQDQNFLKFQEFAKFKSTTQCKTV